jgi:hypothetical protein
VALDGGARREGRDEGWSLVYLVGFVASFIEPNERTKPERPIIKTSQPSAGEDLTKRGIPRLVRYGSRMCGRVSSAY